jgi:hypothetical protein
VSNKEIEKKIIDQYQQDENMMILVFAQWCVNNDLDPKQIYIEAYPNQYNNLALEKTLEVTVPKEEAGEIPDQTLLGVLELFGNHDLAFIVSEKIANRKK